MADKPVKNVFNSATIFESLAMGLDDPAFEDGADELRGMAANHSSLSARNDNRSIALALKSAWSELYGPDTSLWPENLRSALATIEAGVGLTNFSDNLTSALQGLQLEELTVPAFDAAISIVGEGLRPLSLGSPQRGSPTQWSEEGLIPSSAARAGLHFISRPDRLILPLLAGGIAGRLVGGLATELGSAVGMGASSGTALVQVTGLVAESAGFVATSDVVASFMGPDIGPINPSTPLGTSRATTFYEETFASTIFFGALRIFGAAGRFAQALLPMTETGIAVSKAFGHFTSVMGLAATEEIQARMGGVVAEAFRPPQVDGDLKVAATAPHTFYDKLWRALLLHTTIHTVNGIVNVNGAQSEYASIRAKAREMQNMLVIPAVVSGNLVPSLSVIPEVVIGDIVKLSARDSRIRGNDRLPNVMAMNGKDPPPKRPPQISKIVKPDPIKGLMDILSSTAVVEPEPVASMSSSRTSLTVSDKAVVNALKEALQKTPFPRDSRYDPQQEMPGWDRSVGRKDYPHLNRFFAQLTDIVRGQGKKDVKALEIAYGRHIYNIIALLDAGAHVTMSEVFHHSGGRDRDLIDCYTDRVRHVGGDVAGRFDIVVLTNPYPTAHLVRQYIDMLKRTTDMDGYVVMLVDEPAPFTVPLTENGEFKLIAELPGRISTTSFNPRDGLSYATLVLRRVKAPVPEARTFRHPLTGRPITPEQIVEDTVVKIVNEVRDYFKNVSQFIEKGVRVWDDTEGRHAYKVLEEYVLSQGFSSILTNLVDIVNYYGKASGNPLAVPPLVERALRYLNDIRAGLYHAYAWAGKGNDDAVLTSDNFHSFPPYIDILKGFVDDAMDIAGGRDGVMVINGVREETSMDHRGERLWEQGIEIALGKAIRSAVGAARSKVTVEWLDGEEKAFVISFDGKINGANVIRLVVSNSPNMDAFRRKEMGAFFKGMAGQISYERRGEDEARLIASIVAAKGKGGGLKRAMAKAGFLVSKETYGEKPASRHKRVNMAVIVEPPIADIQRVIDDISDSLHYFGYIVIMTDRPSNVRKAVSKHNDGKRKWYEIRLVEDVKDRDGHTMLFRRSGTTFSRRSR